MRQRGYEGVARHPAQSVPTTNSVMGHAKSTSTVPCEPHPKVVQCDQTSVFATSIMGPSEEVDRPLKRPVQPPLRSEVTTWKPYWLFFWCCSCSVAEAGDTVVGADSIVNAVTPCTLNPGPRNALRGGSGQNLISVP